MFRSFWLTSLLSCLDMIRLSISFLPGFINGPYRHNVDHSDGINFGFFAQTELSLLVLSRKCNPYYMHFY